MFNAKIVADSISTQGHRITSMLITFPRYILAEFNTHRMLSRNSASSRAIPTKRMIEMIQENPFVPMKWMKDHKGMQGTEYLDDLSSQFCREIWLQQRDSALSAAAALYEQKTTKQMINRLLEPFMWHTVLVTATEWENFFALRADPAADIHMQEIAKLMLETMNASTPKLLQPGEWHMPFGDDIDMRQLNTHVTKTSQGETWTTIANPNFDFNTVAQYNEWIEKRRLMVSTSRCARTSYLTFGQDPVQHDYEKDFKQHDYLADNGHWSPFEHCAYAMSTTDHTYWGRRVVKDTGTKDERGPNRSLQSSVYESGWCGNFRGWIQYRKTFSNENRKDSRLIKHEK